MQVLLDNVGKKFNKHWIFRNLNHTFLKSTHTAILGNNGSGKSTLLKAIATYIGLTEGTVKYKAENKAFQTHHTPTEISIASPHLELIEELSMAQFLMLHFSLKPSIKNIAIDEIIDALELGKNALKPVKHFSSGMKQRLKLGLAFYSSSKLILLDEPCTNLDKNSRKWYQDTMINTIQDRTLIVFSNNNYEETFSCSSSFHL